MSVRRDAADEVGLLGNTTQFMAIYSVSASPVGRRVHEWASGRLWPEETCPRCGEAVYHDMLPRHIAKDHTCYGCDRDEQECICDSVGSELIDMPFMYLGKVED